MFEKASLRASVMVAPRAARGVREEAVLVCGESEAPFSVVEKHFGSHSRSECGHFGRKC
jgi:hypothetical protein